MYYVLLNVTLKWLLVFTYLFYISCLTKIIHWKEIFSCQFTISHQSIIFKQWYLDLRVKWFTQLCPTLCDPQTVACQASLSMEFSRQENRSGYPFPSPGDLHDPGFNPDSTQIAGRFFTVWATRGALRWVSKGLVNSISDGRLSFFFKT